MTLLEFKKNIGFRLRLLKSSTFFSLQESTAYATNNYANIISTFCYMTTYLIFLGAVFGKVKLIAGYNYSEILLLTLVAQVCFYLVYTVSNVNIDLLAKNVKSGDLDLWITRPVPLLWFVSFQKIQINQLLADSIPATIPLVYLVVINFHSTISPINLLLGIAVMVIGMVISHCFQFIINLLCFWTGESQNARAFAWEMSQFGDAIPFEGYPVNFRKIGMIFIPSVVNSALATSIMLGKIDNKMVIILVFLIMLMFLWLNVRMWRLALDHYSSASS